MRELQPGEAIRDRAGLDEAEVGVMVTDRDDYTLVKVDHDYWALIAPGPQTGRHSYVSSEEINGDMHGEGSKFYPLTVVTTEV